jgi:hypothetical protein
MATLALVASLLLSWFSFSRKRMLARYYGPETLPVKIFGHLFEWSTSLALVLLFYDALLFLLRSGWQWITVDDLLWMERSLAALQHAVDELKPSWVGSLVIIVALYLLTRSWIRLGESTAFSFYRKIKDVLHVMNALLVLLCLFTLLGSQPGNAAATLEIRLHQERSEYGVLRGEMKGALASAAVNQVFEEITKASPNASAAANLMDLSASEADSLRKTYAAALRYHSEPIQHWIDRTEAQRRALRYAAQPRASAEHPPDAIEEIRLPGDTTYRRILRAETNIKKFEDTFRPKLRQLLQRLGANDALMQMPDLAIDSVSKILDPVAGANPWLKPFFDVLTSTVSDKTEMALKEKLDDLTKTAATSPDRVEPLLPEAAEALAKSAPPRITQEAERRFGRELNEIRGQELQVHRLSALLDGVLHPQPKHNKPSKTLDVGNRPPELPPTIPEIGVQTIPPLREVPVYPITVADDTPARLQEFMDGLHSWIVTKNPNGDPQKIFVHTRMEGMSLKDLRYIAKESPNGMTWDVYKVGGDGVFRRIGTGRGAQGGGGGGGGRWIGTIAKPIDIDIGECSCN